jgi:uncharacterized membrane protein
MKKSKFIMAAGTVVLAVAAVFATKANRKFSGDVTKAFLHDGTITSGDVYVVVPASSILTTTTTSLNPAYVSLYTSTGNNKIVASLWTQENGAGKQVYFK